MDRLESMATFVAAVDAGSLSAAARKLGMPLATVSRKVSLLEAHLKTQLVQRGGRRLNLTEAGRSYLEACRRVLEQLDEAERAATGEYSAPKGRLVVGAPIVFGRLHVLPLVSDFLKEFPEIDVRLALSDRVVNLLEEDIELAIRIGELPDSSLVATRVGSVRRVCCAGQEYLERGGKPARPKDVSGHDCITFEAVSSPERWTFGSGKQSETVRVHSRLVVNTAEAAVDAAVAGVGLTRVLSYQVASAERAGQLVRVLRAFEPEPLAVHMLHGGSSLLPARVRAFIEFAAPRLKRRLAHAG